MRARLADAVARRARAAQAAARGPDLRRPPHPPRRTLAGPRRRCAGRRAAARALPRRPRRRVPGHRPDPVGDRARGRSATATTTLVLIGDPKQAIYAFRGADVYAYLDAAAGRGTQATLDVNWRSDQALLDAYDALFGGAQLGHDGIVYRTVRAAAADREPRLQRRAGRAAAHPGRPPRRAAVGTHNGHGVASTPAREHDRARTSPPTSSGCCLDASRRARPSSGRPDASRPATSPCSCARNRNAALVRDALRRGRRPGGHQRRGQRLRHAGRARLAARCSRRSSGRPRRRARTPPRSPRSSAGPPSASPRPTTTTGRRSTRRLHGWARVLRDRGVASLPEAITLAERLPERVLAHGRRRAATDRPAPRRPAAARRGDRASGSARPR